MSPWKAAQPGDRLSAVDTPALVLDLDAFEPVTSEIVQRKASLEDVFLRLTGRELIE